MIEKYQDRKKSGLVQLVIIDGQTCANITRYDAITGQPCVDAAHKIALKVLMDERDVLMAQLADVNALITDVQEKEGV